MRATGLGDFWSEGVPYALAVVDFIQLLARPSPTESVRESPRASEVSVTLMSMLNSPESIEILMEFLMSSGVGVLSQSRQRFCGHI